MWRNLSMLFVGLFGMLVLSACGTYQQRTYSYQGRVIVTPVPAPREVVMIPQGYARCSVAPAGYYNGIWVAPRRVCAYQNMPGRAAWVEGYWACPRYNSMGACNFWEWRRGHWVETYRVY